MSLRRRRGFVLVSRSRYLALFTSALSAKTACVGWVRVIACTCSAQIARIRGRLPMSLSQNCSVVRCLCLATVTTIIIAAVPHSNGVSPKDEAPNKDAPLGKAIEKAAARDCGTQDKVQVKDAVYDFHYDSWIRPNEDKTFFFGRCILAAKPKKMWVDCKKTGVSGWTNEDDGEARGGLEAPS